MLRGTGRNYHLARAAEELDLAEQATDPAVARIHRELGALHRRQSMILLDERGSWQPTFRLVHPAIAG